MGTPVFAGRPPRVDKPKWLTNGLHMNNWCERWAQVKIPSLQVAWFNGNGYESWEVSLAQCCTTFRCSSPINVYCRQSSLSVVCVRMFGVPGMGLRQEMGRPFGASAQCCGFSDGKGSSDRQSGYHTRPRSSRQATGFTARCGR